MLYAIGTRVSFKYTGDEGVIRARLDNGMLSVYLADIDMEIPAHPEDLISGVETLAAPEPLPVEPVVSAIPEVALQYGVLQPWGIQLAFEPTDEQRSAYRVFMINDTRHDCIYDLQLWRGTRSILEAGGRLPLHSFEEIGGLKVDELNESPRLEITVWRSTTAGKEAKQKKQLRIKAKQFFRNVKTAPILNRRVHLYQLFERLDQAPAPSTTQDIREYTKENARPNRRTTSKRIVWDTVDVRAFSEFNNTIDLHIAKLVPDLGKLDKSKILAIQLEAFDTFMEEAIRLGVDRVFVIHGLGRGKLRDHISSRLLQMREVKSFKNEYHHKFGFGATEVLL